MNPFDQPPSTPPVSFASPHEPTRRRGRSALVALAAAGLVGGGLVGVSQLVSADGPEVTNDAARAAIDTPVDDDVDDGGEAPGSPEAPVSPDAPEPDDGPRVDGEIVIDTGDGEPVVIDLGDQLDHLRDCGLPGLGESPWFEFEAGELPDFTLDGELDELLDGLPLDGEFGMFDIDGTKVTVVGPDGVSVIDLGDAGSVTIAKDGDGVVITTEGDAAVEELPEIIGPLGEDLDPDALDELFGDDFDPEAMLDELFGDDFDPEAMLDELFGEFGTGDVDDFELPADLEECLDGLQDD